MRLMPVLIAFHSADWIQVATTSYLHHFPEDQILVVDNNPRRGEFGWDPDCEREQQWLRAHERVLFLEQPLEPFPIESGRLHGEGIDRAVAWCRERAVDVLIHLEPDCLVSGRRWRDNLVRAIADGAWMAGSFRQSFGSIHPTPSAWRVAKIRSTFRGVERQADTAHPRYHALIDVERMRAEVGPRGDWPWWQRFWDTGHKPWFDAAVEDRTALVAAPDFHHYWSGSSSLRRSRDALIALHPELEPWFQRAQAWASVRRPEDCSHRAEVRGEPDGVEVARCRLLAELCADQGLADPCTVRREACEACSASFAPSRSEPNPVVASLLFGVCRGWLARDDGSVLDRSRVERLRDWAEGNLDISFDRPDPPRLPRAGGRCAHQGAVIGSREVATPTGIERIIVWSCDHLEHAEATPEGCLRCRDWRDPDAPPPARLAQLLPSPPERFGPPVHRWAVGVITAPRRRPTLDHCLDSLGRAGWETPRLFVDAATTRAARHQHLPTTLREPRIGAWPNYYLALLELALRQPEADAYLLVEDDAVFFDREDLRAHVESILWPADPIGAVSLYCSSAYTRAEAGWHRVAEAWVWGALALIYHGSAVRQLLRHPAVIAHRDTGESGLRNADVLIGSCLEELGLPVYFPTPSLVQHIGDTSAIWPGSRAVGFRRADRFAGDPI